MDSCKKIILFALITFLAIPGLAQKNDTSTHSKPEERIKYPNTSVSFIPPTGFKQQSKGSGDNSQAASSRVFIHKSTASSLLIFEIPGISYRLYKDTLNTNYFKNQNLELISKQKKSFSKKDGYLFECKFKVKGHPFHRLMYVTGNLDKTILLLVNYPEQVQSDIKQPIYESIRSLRYDSRQ